MQSATDWSNAKKKVARRAFDAALEKALAAALADFKVRAAAVSTVSEMWTIGEDLHRKRPEIDQLFDYRYSQLTRVFAGLIHLSLMNDAALAGLADEKQADIHRELSFLKRRDGAGQ